jgi:hypothetical protein
MRKEQGYAIITNADGTVEEHSTSTCGHCNRITHLKVGQRAEDIGGLCYVCWRVVCPECVGKGCDVIEKKLERMEASYHARRSYGI